MVAKPTPAEPIQIAEPVTSVEIARRYGISQAVVAEKFRNGVLPGVFDGRRWVADWSAILELERPGRGRLTGEARERAKRPLLDALAIAPRIGKVGKDPRDLVRKEVVRGHLAGLELKLPGGRDLRFDEDVVAIYWARRAACTRTRQERQAQRRLERATCPGIIGVVRISRT